jgi:hypothetical protein
MQMNDDGGGGGGDEGRPGGVATTDTSAGGMGPSRPDDDAGAPTVDDGGSSGAVHRRHAHHNRRYRGVYHEPDKGLWRARLYWRGKHTTLGRYSTPEAAARAHDRAAIYVFGPSLAITNFRDQAVERAVVDQLLLLPRDEFQFHGKVAARLVELRRLVQQQPRAPYVQVERDARARRRAAASAALGCWVEENPGRRHHQCRSTPSSTALRRLLESSMWRALILAAVLVPPTLPAVSSRGEAMLDSLV